MKMSKTHAIKLFKNLFAPLLAISTLFLVGAHFLNSSIPLILLDSSFVSSVSIFMIITSILQLVLGGVLYFLSLHHHIDKILRNVFYTLITLAFAFMLFSLQKEKVIINHAQDILQCFLSENAAALLAPLLKLWPLSCLYFTLKLLSFSLFSLFIFGALNFFLSKNDGIKFYLLFVSIGGVISSCVDPLKIFISRFNSSSLNLIVGVGLAISLISVYLLNRFIRTYNFLHDGELSHEKKELKGPFYYLAATALLASPTAIKYFLNLISRYDFKVISQTKEIYFTNLSNFSFTTGAISICLMVLFPLAGTILAFRKGLREVAKDGYWFLLGSCAVFGLLLSIKQSPIWLTQGFASGVLVGSKEYLLFPLIQILYLYFVRDLRFKFKIVTEMILVPLFLIIPSLISQGAIMLTGSFESSLNFMRFAAALFFVILMFFYKSYIKKSSAT
jgi:hypothetical protein